MRELGFLIVAAIAGVDVLRVCRDWEGCQVGIRSERSIKLW